MYAKTRISAISREFDHVFGGAVPSELAKTQDHHLGLLRQPEELALIKQLDSFPEILTEALHQLKPNLMTSYAFELARLFHDFYEKHWVVDAAQPELSRARMALLSGVDIVFGRLFGLLGLFAPRYM
jgi:arginyl-tRNA synthetase